MKSKISKIFGWLSVLPVVLGLFAVIAGIVASNQTGITADTAQLFFTPFNQIKNMIPTNWYTLFHNLLNAFNITTYTYYDYIITFFMWAAFTSFIQLAFNIIMFLPNWMRDRFEV